MLPALWRLQRRSVRLPRRPMSASASRSRALRARQSRSMELAEVEAMRVPVFNPEDHPEEVQQEFVRQRDGITDAARIVGGPLVYAPISSFRHRKPPLQERFVRMLMHGGKKSVAERVLADALREVGAVTGSPPASVFALAVDNVRPLVETKSISASGGRSVQVPVPVNPYRGEGLAIKWLIKAARARAKGRPMRTKLAGELVDAAKRLGAAVKKREDVHKDAERNKINAHLRVAGSR